MSLHVLPAGVLSHPTGVSIGSIRASRVFTWDATISTTAQTIANQEASPADGEDQTTYDVQNGSSTDSDSRDVTYVSTTGEEFYKSASSSALDYLTMEGFKTTTAFTHSLHKDDAQFTIEIGYFHAGVAAGGYLVSTAEDTNDTGISVNVNGSEKIKVFAHRGTNGSYAGEQEAAAVLPDGFSHILIVIDEGVTNGSFYYVNGSVTDTFTLTYSSPSTGDSTYNWHWLTSLLDGNTGAPRFGLHTGAGVGYFAVYNKEISSSEATVLYDNSPTRFQTA